MSAVRMTRPDNKAATGLRAIAGGKLTSLTRAGANSKSRMVFALTLLGGIMGIQLLKLALGVSTTQNAYHLSDLVGQKKDLIITQQILAEQVDSLSSNQNLANTAQKMGMISNANPVFLRLSDKRVFGKPKAALNAQNRISRNLVPSSIMTVTSNVTTSTDATATAEAASTSNLFAPAAGSATASAAGTASSTAAATSFGTPVSTKSTFGTFAKGTAVVSGTTGATGSTGAATKSNGLPVQITH